MYCRLGHALYQVQHESNNIEVFFLYLINRNAFNNLTSDQLSFNRVQEGLKLEMVVKATFS